VEREASVGADRVHLQGDLSVPSGATGVVAFAHGTGSGRHSPRNRRVAQSLQDTGFATLLLDLLTEEEERADLRDAHLRFDIGLLASRLTSAMAWLEVQAETSDLPVGLFGASTGAAAALVAATERRAGAIVSRGGRPDLAGDALDRVEAPTLLIVGSLDLQVLDLNRDALGRMRCEKELRVIDGATHLFEEPGKLEEVADAARAWFLAHLGGER
jgi:putative phosphoribosyl transferase